MAAAETRGAIYRNDFIELRNREAFDVNVAGWSVQYTSSAGTPWATTPLSGIIPAGGYYLVQEAAGAGGTLALPAPDATGTIAMSAASGKIALVATLAPLSGGCPAAGLLDFVGYGAATCFEGSAAAPTLSNTTAAARLGLGSTDTNDNRSGLRCRRASTQDDARHPTGRRGCGLASLARQRGATPC